MPNFPRTSRVSIVIPLQRDEKLFEETLLSVLENRPEDCQVIVAHNGTYGDPFQLSDEVDFVTARSSNLVDLVRDAFDATTAPIVHVLGTGMKATSGWVSDAIERFSDHDVAAVTPCLINPASERISGGGWFDGGGRYCQPHSGNNRADVLSGFYLNAFFAQRSLLGNLLDAIAPAMNDPVAVSYAMGCLLKRAGWKTVSARDCQIQSDQGTAIDDPSDGDRGRCLGAIRSRVLPGEPGPSIPEMLRAAFFGPSSIGEMLGMLRHRSGLAAMRRSIDPESVANVHESPRIRSMVIPETAARRDAA